MQKSEQSGDGDGDGEQQVFLKVTQKLSYLWYVKGGLCQRQTHTSQRYRVTPKSEGTASPKSY